MRILILGGTGPLGRALVQRLRGADPNAHIALVSRAQPYIPGASEVVRGDQAVLLPSPEFAERLAGFDAVVHLGDGLAVLQRGGWRRLRQADVLIGASESMARAVAAARVPLFVYVSSIKALCDEEDERVLVESSEPRPTTLYGRSKLRLERSFAATFEGSATRHVVIRNPVTYGPGGAGSIRHLIALADTALPLPFKDLANRRSLLAEHNFASALAAVVRAGPSGSGVFHIHDGTPLTMTEIVTALREALGRSPRLFSIGAMTARVARNAPIVGPLARRLYGSLALSDTLFRSSYNWNPEVTSRVALAQIIRRRRQITA